MSDFPEVHFGEVGKKPVDWRKKISLLDNIDDDRKLVISPNDVTEMLGFDPLELDKE